LDHSVLPNQNDPEDDTCDQVILFINEENKSKSPQLVIKFENKEVAFAMLDSGSEVNLISQDKFDQLQKVGIEVLTLPVQGINIVTAFGKRSKSIKLQLLTEFTIGGERFEAVLLVASQLNCDVILGCNFLKEYGIQLRFDTERIEYVRQGQTKSLKLEISDDKTSKEIQTNEVKVTTNVVTGEKHGSDSNEARTADNTVEEAGTTKAHAMGCVMLKEDEELRVELDAECGNQRGRTAVAEDDVTYSTANYKRIREGNEI
jgi:hypothetical protein